MRKIIAAPIVAGLIGFAALAAPLAAHAAGTPTTFDLQGGTLSITVPDGSTTAIDLGLAHLSDNHVSGSLGAVTVDDERGLLSGSWDASAQSSAFVTGTTGNTTTLLASAVTYSAGTTSGSTGTGTFTAAAGGADVAIGSSATVMSASSEVGSPAGITWDPTITVALPTTGVVAGIYSGTITHSVA